MLGVSLLPHALNAPMGHPVLPEEQEELPGTNGLFPGTRECNGLTMHQVALAWFQGVGPLSAGDAAATCVPALVMAAGCSFNTTTCPDMFDPESASGISKGLWLVRSLAAPLLRARNSR